MTCIAVFARPDCACARAATFGGGHPGDRRRGVSHVHPFPLRHLGGTASRVMRRWQRRHRHRSNAGGCTHECVGSREERPDGSVLSCRPGVRCQHHDRQRPGIAGSGRHPDGGYAVAWISTGQLLFMQAYDAAGPGLDPRSAFLSRSTPPRRQPAAWPSSRVRWWCYATGRSSSCTGSPGMWRYRVVSRRQAPGCSSRSSARAACSACRKRKSCRSPMPGRSAFSAFRGSSRCERRLRGCLGHLALRHRFSVPRGRVPVLVQQAGATRGLPGTGGKFPPGGP